MIERLRDQRRDADRECGPTKGHPVGRCQSVGAVTGEAVRQRCVQDPSAGEPDDPPGAGQADRPPECGEEQHLGDQPDNRAGMNRPPQLNTASLPVIPGS